MRQWQNTSCKLLKMLPEGGSTAFGVFLDVLAREGQSNVAFDLLKQERAAQVKGEEQIGPTPTTEGRRH